MRPLALALAAVLLAPVPAQAAPRDDTALIRLQARDRQLFAVGWRLAVANAPFCEGPALALGIAVLDAGSFDDPSAVRRELALTGDLAAGAVAPGSPAAAAGIAANDTLLALNGTALGEQFPRSRPSWQRLVDVAAALDHAASAGPVTLTAARGSDVPRTITLTGVPACPSRFEVLDSGGRAMAE